MMSLRKLTANVQMCSLILVLASRLCLKEFINGAAGFIVVRCFKCFLVFHLYMFLFFSFNNYVSRKYIQLSLGNRVATFSGKGCKPHLLFILFVGVSLYLSVFLFHVGDLVWTRLYQFLSSLIYLVDRYVYLFEKDEGAY